MSILVAATLAAASLAACSSHRSTNPPSSSPAPTALTAWQSVLRQIKPDGTVTTETALSAFAMAIGPVPGGVVPAGPSQEIASGTIAIRWVLTHWGDLSAAQHSAILTDLGIDPVTNKPVSYLDAPVARAPGDPPPNFPCHTKDGDNAAKYRAMIPGVEAAVAGKLGRRLTIDSGTFVVVNTENGGKTGSGLWYTVPCRDGSGKLTGCTFHVNPRAAGHSDEDMRDFLIHEMVHCFMYDKYDHAHDTMADWYGEGGPSWVASVLGTRNSELDINQWKAYLDSAAIPLIAHRNDGLGFFVHLAESGVDPWTVMDKMADAMVALKTLDPYAQTTAAWGAAGITPRFLDTWGSGIVTGRYPGSAWMTTGPNLMPYQPPIVQASVGNGGGLALTSVPYAPNIEQVKVTAEVLMLKSGAATTGRMSLGNSADTTVDKPGPYCAIANCSCPAGSPGAGTAFTKLSSNTPYVGFTGGDQGGQVIMVGYSMADFCQKSQTPCVVGQWVSTGFDLRVNNLVETGGAGIKVHIDDKGNVTEVLDGMKPVVFQQQASGMQIAGSIVFNGTFSGSITLPPADATSGIWIQASPPNVTPISVAVHLTSPFDSDLGTFDLSNLASAGSAAGAISTDPIGVGSWTCSGDTLTSQPPPSSNIQGVWTLTRTAPA